MADLEKLRIEVVAMAEELFTVVNMPFQDTTELQRQVLASFAFGMLFAFGQLHKLTAPEVHALALCLIQDVFKYSDHQAASFADKLIESANGRGNPTIGAVIHRGVDGHRQMEMGQTSELKNNLEEIFEIVCA